MRRLFVQAGLTAALAAVTTAGLASSAAATPVDGSYCSVFEGSGACTAQWYADVNGEYGGLAYGSWEVDVRLIDPTTGAVSWAEIATGGPGPFEAAPGALTEGSTYRLVITGSGGGSIGSATGTGTI